MCVCVRACGKKKKRNLILKPFHVFFAKICTIKNFPLYGTLGLVSYEVILGLVSYEVILGLVIYCML